MIEMGRCGRRVALLTGYVVVCGVWFGSSSPLRRKGGFSNKWMSRLEVVDERWDWAGAVRGLDMLCFPKARRWGGECALAEELNLIGQQREIARGKR